MGEFSKASTSESISIGGAMRPRFYELSSAAVANIALAVGGVLALVWFAALLWIFGLITG